MHVQLQECGLGMCFVGAILIALTDVWLSRSFLIYLDAVESNVSAIVDAFRAGNTRVAVTLIDLKRDRGQNRARALKMLGWLVLTLGFGLQVAIIHIAAQ
jgi:hypothetical protein